MRNVRIGMLTPSSNTVVEPVTFAICQSYPGLTCHFSRFQVTEISLGNASLAQFEHSPFMTAAALLADAQVDVIAWNGTSSAWRGFSEDERLCEAIQAEFGIPTTASMMALNHILSAKNQKSLGLVTPYLSEVQQQILENYSKAGFECVAEDHLGIKVNFDFARVSADDIRTQVSKVAESKPQAIIVVCTNVRAAPLVEELEREYGIPIYDSTSAVVWHALRLAGVDTSDVRGWGSLFGDPTLNA